MKDMTIVGVKTPLNREFFRHWLSFLTPIHKLTEKDADILASFLYKRHILSQSINDDDILDSVIMSTQIRKEIREEFDMSSAYFQVVLNKLRNKGIIVNNKIIKKFIPDVDLDTKNYKLILHFKIEDDQK